MILNVSSRTDIVAFYSEWFMNRYREGYVDVRNPFNPKMVSRIYFENVDAILFCTKNPIPILKDLEKIKVPTLFHITITPYHSDIEPNVPDKRCVIEAVKRISSIIGKEHVTVRYDPIFISHKYSVEYHKKAFDKLCTILNGYVSRIIVSFIDDYKNVRKNKAILDLIPFTKNTYREIGISFSKSASNNHMTVQTCFEDENLVEYGFIKGECLSHELAYKLTGKSYKNWTARKERKCNCVEMVDIGVYNSCMHRCIYCYANYDEKQVGKNVKDHHLTSSLLIGKLQEDDIVKIRVS